jgi:hypothetical protein
MRQTAHKLRWTNHTHSRIWRSITRRSSPNSSRSPNKSTTTNLRDVNRQTPARQIYRDARNRIEAACTDCEKWVKTFGWRRGWHRCKTGIRQVVSYDAPSRR